MSRLIMRLLAALAAPLLAGAVTFNGAQAEAGAAISGYSVSVAPVTQDDAANCWPAIASMYLSAFGFHVSQDLLAIQMHTDPVNGTDGARAAQVVNAWLYPRHVMTDGLTGLAGHQLTRTLTAQLRAGRPVILAVHGNLMPWRKGAPATIHMIIATGISGGMVKVFDPSSVYGGRYAISAGELGRGLVAAIITVKAVP